MKKLKRLGIYIFIFSVVIVLPLLLNNPTSAVNSRNQMMIELGIIDDVKSAEELGLEHLLRHPPQLQASLMDNLREGQRATAQDTSNISRAIEIGVRGPINVGDFQNDNGDTRLRRGYNVIGSVTRAGEVEPIVSRDLRGMFANEEANEGTLAAFDGSTQKLIADASGTWLQAETVPVFDLIVYEKQTGKIYLVPSVVGDAFCRDALNYVLRTNGDLARNYIDLSGINARRMNRIKNRL